MFAVSLLSSCALPRLGAGAPSADVFEAVIDELHSEGFEEITEIIRDGDTLCSVSLSLSGNRLDYRDIPALRAVRNKARILALSGNGCFDGITSLRNVIKDPAGNVVYDVTISDFAAMPEEFEDSAELCSKAVLSGPGETRDALRSAFEEHGILPFEITVSEAAINGYCASVVIEGVPDEISRNVLSAIEDLNRKGGSVSEYRLTVTGAPDGGVICYMSADLIFRDFLWWQLPGTEGASGS